MGAGRGCGGDWRWRLLVAWGPTASAEPGPASVTVTVDASANPSPFGLDVTYTADVVTSDGGDVAPFDTIWFEDDGGNINGCGAQTLSSTPTPGHVHGDL